MIKHINPQNVTTTPFVAAKSVALSNTQNSDLVILEPSVYSDGTSVSLDYIDYNSGPPFLNRECNIALEQQEQDVINYEEGITGFGKFNTTTDPQNIDGTYKRLVHRTIKNTFYNTYQNPTEILGIEYIDFPVSNTIRNFSDRFRMFSVPQLTFGDKIQPNSLQFYDNLLDDNVVIFDDGYQNLIAGYNLFSKIQEVRFYSYGINDIITGSVTSSYQCPTYGQINITDPVSVSVYEGTNVTFSVSASGNPLPISFQWYSSSYVLVDGGRFSGSNGPVLYISDVQMSDTGSYRAVATNTDATVTSNWAGLDIKTGVVVVTGSDGITSSVVLRFGSTQTAPPYVEPSVPSFGYTMVSGSVVNVVFTSSVQPDSQSIGFGFQSGYIFNAIIRPPPIGFDSQSIGFGFQNGYIFNVIIRPPPIGFDSQSIGFGFESGGLSTVVTPISQTEAQVGLAFVMVSGSVY